MDTFCLKYPARITVDLVCVLLAIVDYLVVSGIHGIRGVVHPNWRCIMSLTGDEARRRSRPREMCVQEARSSLCGDLLDDKYRGSLIVGAQRGALWDLRLIWENHGYYARATAIFLFGEVASLPSSREALHEAGGSFMISLAWCWVYLPYTTSSFFLLFVHVGKISIVFAVWLFALRGLT